MISFKRAFNAFLDFLYPQEATCSVCLQETFGEGKNYLCKKCLDKLKPLKDGKAYDGVQVYSSCFYNDFSRQIILSAKDGDKPKYLDVEGAFIAETIEKSDLKADVLIAVPSFLKSKLKRGFDHMKNVAEFVAEKTGIPFENTLKRRKEGDDQTDLSYEERFQNVKDDFEYVGEGLYGKTVLLLDDVVTSGATLNACKNALLAAKPKAVLAVTFARSH